MTRENSWGGHATDDAGDRTTLGGETTHEGSGNGKEYTGEDMLTKEYDDTLNIPELTWGQKIANTIFNGLATGVGIVVDVASAASPVTAGLNFLTKKFSPSGKSWGGIIKDKINEVINEARINGWSKEKTLEEVTKVGNEAVNEIPDADFGGAEHKAEVISTVFQNLNRSSEGGKTAYEQILETGETTSQGFGTDEDTAIDQNNTSDTEDTGSDTEVLEENKIYSGFMEKWLDDAYGLYQKKGEDINSSIEGANKTASSYIQEYKDEINRFRDTNATNLGNYTGTEKGNLNLFTDNTNQNTRNYGNDTNEATKRLTDSTNRDIRNLENDRNKGLKWLTDSTNENVDDYGNRLTDTAGRFEDRTNKNVDAYGRSLTDNAKQLENTTNDATNQQSKFLTDASDDIMGNISLKPVNFSFMKQNRSFIPGANLDAQAQAVAQRQTDYANKIAGGNSIYGANSNRDDKTYGSRTDGTKSIYDVNNNRDSEMYGSREAGIGTINTANTDRTNSIYNAKEKGTSTIYDANKAAVEGKYDVGQAGTNYIYNAGAGTNQNIQDANTKNTSDLADRIRTGFTDMSIAEQQKMINSLISAESGNGMFDYLNNYKNLAKLEQNKLTNDRNYELGVGSNAIRQQAVDDTDDRAQPGWFDEGLGYLTLFNKFDKEYNS